MADNVEPFGTTAIPTGSYRIKFEESKLDALFFGDSNGIAIAQQPRTQAFATYEPEKNETLEPLITLNGNLIDVNSSFVVYALKNGLIRVLHRHSAMRTLLRGHSNQTVTDISFFQDGDTLATVGNDPPFKGPRSTLIVWRVFENPPQIGSERLLEISNLDYGGAPDITMSKLFWHPFDPNKFFIGHSTFNSKQVATLVETTRIQTKAVVHHDPKDKINNKPRQHSACQWYSPYCMMENALQLRLAYKNESEDNQLVDLAWSGRNANHVMSVHKNGIIVLWNLKEKDISGLNEAGDTVVPKKLVVLYQKGVEHSRCIFLPHEQFAGLSCQRTNLESVTTCFVTASSANSIITLWSSVCQAKNPANPQDTRRILAPTMLQELDFGTVHPSSYILNLCVGPVNVTMEPLTSFLLLGSRDAGKIYALRVKAEWPRTTGKEEGADNGNDGQPRCAGVDYIVPFTLKHPVYSWNVMCGPTDDDDIADELSSGKSGSGFDIQTFAYQSKTVQCLTITSNMSKPPKYPIPPTSGSGSVYTLDILEGPCSSSDTAIDDADVVDVVAEELDYGEEDYDVDGDDDEMEAVGSPTPTVNPTETTSLVTTAAASDGLFPIAPNPFANWLGTLAGTGPTVVASERKETLLTPPARPNLPMPPGIGLPSSSPGILPSSSLCKGNSPQLNPFELLAKSMDGDVSTTTSDATKSNDEKAKKPLKRSRKAKSPHGSRPQNTTQKKVGNNTNANTIFPAEGVQILKRDATMPPPPSSDPSVLSDPALLMAAGIHVLPTTSHQPTVAQAVIDFSVLEKHVQKIVEANMAKFLVPAIRKSIQDSVAILSRPLHKLMDSLSQKGVSVTLENLRDALDVETPLKAAFTDNLKNIVVPSLQSITGQILQQFQASMPKLRLPQNDTQLLKAMTQELQVMTSKMDALSAEVQELRKTVSDQSAAIAAARQRHYISSNQSQSSADNKSGNNDHQIRNQIDLLMAKGQYEEAFTKAVASPTPQLTVYCCARSEIRKVLTDGVLSQPILICLMQHLSAGLAAAQSPQELNIEIAWLQEITLTMNPTDPSIVQHVPKVLRQLVSNVNQRLTMEGHGGQFRRLLQMLLNSLMGMQLQLGN